MGGLGEVTAGEVPDDKLHLLRARLEQIVQHLLGAIYHHRVATTKTLVFGIDKLCGRDERHYDFADVSSCGCGGG